MIDSQPDPAPSAMPGPVDPTGKVHPVRRLLGTSRYLILGAVVGSYIASATLMIYGVMRSWASSRTCCPR